jgi:hypothetical protein
MYELFITHADICFRMAAAATAGEVRDQWKQLGAHCRSKADACELRPQAPRENVKQSKVSGPALATTPAPQHLAAPETLAVSTAPKPAIRMVK